MVLVPFLGCSPSAEVPIDLPAEELIMARGRFGVILPHYARIHQEANSRSEILDILRRAVVVELIAAAPFQTRERESLDYWYRIRYPQVGLGGVIQNHEGWVFGLDIELYSTRVRAQNAAKELEASDDAVL